MALETKGLHCTESLGPFNTYHLTFGLSLRFVPTQAIIQGGNSSCVKFTSAAQPTEFGLLPSASYMDLVLWIEKQVGVKLLGIDRTPLLSASIVGSDQGLSASPNEVVFQVEEGVVSHKWLSEDLLTRLQRLESVVRHRLISMDGITQASLHTSEELSLWYLQLVRAGKLGPNELEQALRELEKQGIPVRRAFFVHNAQEIAEDMRNVMEASCYDLAMLCKKLQEINEDIGDSNQLTRPPVPFSEQTLMSERVDELSFAFSSSVIHCYSALEMLYELFVYLTRVPFGEPKFPEHLHFPDVSGRQVFQEGGAPMESDLRANVLPKAIPNLVVGHFRALRRTRNDLVHNMAADGTRPMAYVGFAMPLVNDLSLQYVQYPTHDIDTATGSPVATSWCRRFYQCRSDAQTFLYSWIEQAWQCIFDTIDWLTHRIAGHYASSPGGGT